MSGGEDFRKVEDGLKLLQLNFQRIADKFQHLHQTVGYLADELVLFRNNLMAVNDLLSQLKATRQEKPEKAEGEET